MKSLVLNPSRPNVIAVSTFPRNAIFTGQSGIFWSISMRQSAT